MFPLLTGLITGGASLLGSIFSSNTASQNSQANIAMQQQTNQLNAEEAQKNREFNSAEALLNREFQENMSNTAFRRSSNDMLQAGLNPMMMFGSGGPASSPGGATASGSPARFDAPRQENRSALAGIGEAVEKSVSSAISMKQFEKMTEEISNIKVARDKLEAEAVTERERPAQVRATTETEKRRPSQVEAQTKTERERPAQVSEEVERLKADIARTKLETKLREHGMNRAIYESKSAGDLLTIPDESRKTLNVLGWGGQKLNDALSVIINAAGKIGRR